MAFLLFPDWYLEDAHTERQWVFARYREDYGHSLFFVPPSIKPGYVKYAWTEVRADWVLVAENVGTLALVAIVLASMPTGGDTRALVLRERRRVALALPLLMPTPAKGMLILPLALEMSYGIERPFGIVFALFGAGTIYIAYAAVVYWSLGLMGRERQPTTPRL